MVKCGCKVRFGKFIWDRRGYAEVMDGGGVQAILKARAGRIAKRLTSGYKAKPGEKPPYVVKRVRGRLAHGYIVGTATPDAMRRELKENSMKREIDGGDA